MVYSSYFQFQHMIGKNEGKKYGKTVKLIYLRKPSILAFFQIISYKIFFFFFKEMMRGWNDKNSYAKIIVRQICKFIPIPLILMTEILFTKYSYIFFLFRNWTGLWKCVQQGVKVRVGYVSQVDYIPPPLFQRYLHSNN